MITAIQPLDAIVHAGLFRDRQQAMDHAVNTLFVTRPQLRCEAAVELFRCGEVSLLRAADLARVDFESIRRLLQDRGIAWEVEADSAEQMDQDTDRYFANRD